MSGKNWLERDPKDSPGLQRIREAQQAKIARGKKEAEEAIRQRESINAENARQLQLQIRHEEMQRKLASMKPALEEIRDFANRTKTYPITPKCVNANGEVVLLKGANVAEGVTATDGSREILELSYVFRGEESESMLTSWDPDHPHSNSYSLYWRPAVHFVGIQLRKNESTGEIELFSRKTVTMPAVENITPHTSIGRGRGSVYFPYGRSGHKEHQILEECWTSLPDDINHAKQLLVERFHDPMDLRSIFIEDLQDKAEEDQGAKSPLELLIKKILGFSA